MLTSIIRPNTCRRVLKDSKSLTIGDDKVKITLLAVNTIAPGSARDGNPSRTPEPFPKSRRAERQECLTEIEVRAEWLPKRSGQPRPDRVWEVL